MGRRGLTTNIRNNSSLTRLFFSVILYFGAAMRRSVQVSDSEQLVQLVTVLEAEIFCMYRFHERISFRPNL
jgi:hypothetical protein